VIKRKRSWEKGNMSKRVRFRPVGYLLSVLVGVVLGGVVVVQGQGLSPGVWPFFIPIVLAVPAWILFLPMMVFCLRFMNSRGWTSPLHHCLMGSSVGLVTVALLVLLGAASGRIPISIYAVSQVAWYLAAAAVGGFAAGYVYWGSEREPNPPIQ
jgi:hypothetical protein